MAVAASPGPPSDGKIKTVEITKGQEKAPKDGSSDVTANVERKDSGLHVEKTKHLGDASELVLAGPQPVKKRPSKNPGILKNEYAAVETKFLQKSKTSFADDPIHQSGNGERTESNGEEQSHVEKLRRETVKRKGEFHRRPKATSLTTHGGGPIASSSRKRASAVGG